MTVVLLGMALALGAEEPAPLAEPPLGPPLTVAAEIDALTSEVSDGLRCPTCQGLSVDDSPADGARAMKARIRELVAQGYTREQIEDYFVDRYGTWVLLSPPATGVHWAVWLGPLAFLLVGAGLLALRGRGGGAGVAASAAEEPSPVPEADDGLEPYRRRILAELEGV